MKIRLSGFADVDPLAVPLPSGTEVLTRVDREVGEHRVTQGAIGRVVASKDGTFDVHIVGVGVVRYLRDEILPRKLGQVRFAKRRDESFGALSHCVVLESIVGSQAWGLADASSDVDRRGVFVLPFSWTIGLVEPPLDLVSADGSTTYWEVGKALRQAIRADPNTLEVFFVDTIEVRDEIGQWLIEARDAFVSAEIYGSFGRYALSQLKRLKQSQRLAEHRHVVLRWLRDNPSLTLDELAGRLAAESSVAAPTEHDALLRAKDYIKQLYRSMYDQGLLDSRDLPSLARYACSEASDAELDVPRELRPKNAYNLLRLIDTAIHWLRTGEPRMKVSGPLRNELLAVKSGKVSLDAVLDRAEERAQELDEARHSTKLPKRADVARVDSLLRRIREEAARRYLGGAAGPLGSDAPAFPEAAWDSEQSYHLNPEVHQDANQEDTP